MRRWFKKKLTVAITVAMLSPATSLSEFLELNEDDSLIVELRLSRFTLSDAAIAYSYDDSTYISFQDFTDALDYAIEIESEDGIASGWFLSKENTFELNIAKKEVFIRGKKQRLPDDFRYSSDDFGLYIDIDYLMKWFGLSINFHMSRLQIVIESEVLQPVEQRLLRIKSRRKNKPASGTSNQFPIIEDQYLLLGPVGLDFQLDLREGNGAGVYNYSIQSTSDVLLHETHVSHTRSSGSSQSITRLGFFRDADRPKMDIAYGITHYSFGDIYRRGDSLVSSSTSGVGFHFKRQIAQSLDESFSRRDFEGNAPPGWEVELYRNGLFMDVRHIDGSGQYIFEDIDLQYGENLFEVRLFGPQGQKRVKKERIRIGTDLITPGQWQFSVTGLKDKDQLFDGPSSSSDNTQDNKSLSLSAHYGIRDQHSIGMAYNKVAPFPNSKEIDYARIIWISSYSALSSRVELGRDIDNGGNAINLNLTGRLFNQDFSYEHQRFNHFSSENSNGGTTLQQMELNFFGSFNLLKSHKVSYASGLSHLETVDGNKHYRLSNQLGFSYGRTRISNQLRLSGDNQGSAGLFTGILTINRAARWYQLRGGLDYDISELEITSISFTTDLKKAPWSFQIQGSRSLIEDDLSTLTVNISRLYGDMSISLVGYIDSGHNASIGLSFGMGLFTHAKKPYFSRRKYGSLDSGSARARVFLDADQNGIFTEGDSTLAGVTFKGRSAWSQRETNDDGEILLSGIDALTGSVIEVDTLTLEDPYLKPNVPAFRLISHAGGVQYIDIPVQQTTEVEGHVYLQKGDKKKGVGGVPVGLYHQGKLVLETKTEFDGYYLFNNVLPGEYITDLVDENGVMSKYRWQPSEAFVTDMDSGITIVPDLVLARVGKKMTIDSLP